MGSAVSYSDLPDDSATQVYSDLPQDSQSAMGDTGQFFQALNNSPVMHYIESPIASVVKGGMAAQQNLGSADYYSNFANNLGQGISAISDYAANPQTQQAVSAMNYQPKDYAANIMQGFQQTPIGQGLNLVGAATLPISATLGLANKAVVDTTGVDPNELNLGEMLAPGILKGVDAVAPGSVAAAGNVLKSIPGKYSDFVQNITGSGGDDDPPSGGGGGFLSNQSSGGKPPLPQGPTMQQIADASSANYKAMKASGTEINGAGVSLLGDGVNSAINDRGLLDEELHPRTISVLNKINDAVQSGQMSLQKADQLGQLLNGAAQDAAKAGNLQDAGMASTAKDGLDNALYSLDKSHLNNGTPEAISQLENARALYAAKSNMQRIQTIIDNGQLMPNPAQAMQAGMRGVVKKPGALTQDEIAAAKSATQSGPLTGAVKLAGNRLIGGALGAGIGHLAGGEAGAVLGGIAQEAIAHPIKAIAGNLQASRLNNVINTIANRPEVQQAMSPAGQAAMRTAQQTGTIAPTALQGLAPNEAMQVLNQILNAKQQAGVLNTFNGSK